MENNVEKITSLTLVNGKVIRADHIVVSPGNGFLCWDDATLRKLMVILPNAVIATEMQLAQDFNPKEDLPQPPSQLPPPVKA